MAPKKKPAGDNMKQKSLMGYFSKTTPSKHQPKFKKANMEIESEDEATVEDTPEVSKEGTEKPVIALSAAVPASEKVNTPSSPFPKSSSSNFNSKSTPPTSDPVDVDMVSEDDDEKMSKAKTVCDCRISDF